MTAFVLVTLFTWTCLNLETFFRRRTPQPELIDKWTVRWARLQLKIFGVHTAASGPHWDAGEIYRGQGPGGVGRIFVCNHRSSVDIPLLLSLAQAHPISRHDLANWPVVGRGARRVGTLFVDRASRRSGANVLKQVDAVLSTGEGVVMFPEGSSYLGDEIRPLRPGAFKAAQRAGAQIVPLGIAYSREDAGYYHEAFLQHGLRVAAFPRLDVAAVAGEPVSLDDRSPVDVREEVRATLQDLVDRARKTLNEAASQRGEEAARRHRHPSAEP